MVFGFGLKAKIERVIEDDFNYLVSDIQRPTFNALVSEGKAMDQNEYSIAIFYMMIMMNSLADPMEGYERDEKGQKEAVDFIKLHSQNILRVIHLANSPESDIKEMLDDVLKKVS